MMEATGTSVTLCKLRPDYTTQQPQRQGSSSKDWVISPYVLSLSVVVVTVTQARGYVVGKKLGESYSRSRLYERNPDGCKAGYLNTSN